MTAIQNTSEYIRCLLET